MTWPRPTWIITCLRSEKIILSGYSYSSLALAQNAVREQVSKIETNDHIQITRVEIGEDGKTVFTTEPKEANLTPQQWMAGK
jgi:hypothetical protein